MSGIFRMRLQIMNMARTSAWREAILVPRLLAASAMRLGIPLVVLLGFDVGLHVLGEINRTS